MHASIERQLAVAWELSEDTVLHLREQVRRLESRAPAVTERQRTQVQTAMATLSALQTRWRALSDEQVQTQLGVIREGLEASLVAVGPEEGAAVAVGPEEGAAVAVGPEEGAGHE